MRNKVTMLFLIVLLGAILRLILLDRNPPSLNWDEVSHGFNAYSILTTGSDEWGTFPIVNFRAYGDYPLPLNLYLTMPFVAAFGLNEFSIRLPHALLGILTIIATFYLIKGTTKSENVALLTSFLVAIDPWTVFTSRFVAQSNLSVFFLVAGMALFFNRDKNKRFLLLSYIFLILTLFSYHTTRIFTPLLFIALITIYRKIMKPFFVFFFIFILVLIFFSGGVAARSKFVFLINEGAINKIVEARQNSKFNPLITRVLYNRPAFFLKEFSKNYVDYFSPNFLFVKGGTQYQFSVQNHGLLYLINLPLFYIGLAILIRKVLRLEGDYLFLAIWLVLAPIPAALTTEKFAVLRATTLIPLPQLLSSLGVLFLIDRFKKVVSPEKLTTAYVIFLLLLLENYIYKYFTGYRINYSKEWQYGYKEAVGYVKKNYNNYDKIVVTKKYGEPHEFFLFYGGVGTPAPWPWDPERYKTNPQLNRFNQSDWWWVDGFDKFIFVNDWQIKDREKEHEFITESKKIINCLSKRCLLITSPNNYPVGWKKLETINFLDSHPVFEIYEN